MIIRRISILKLMREVRRTMTAGMIRQSAIFLILSTFLLFAPVLWAHHGLARFDTSHIVEMHGTVTDFKWINPHAYVYADLIDQQGKAANWALECGSLGMLSRFGWSPTVLKHGDKVTVRGFVAKDHTPYMSLSRIELPNGKALPGAP